MAISTEMSDKAPTVKCMDSAEQSGLGCSLYSHWHGMAFRGSGLNDISMTSVYLKKSVQIPGLGAPPTFRGLEEKETPAKETDNSQRKRYFRRRGRQMDNVEHGWGGGCQILRGTVSHCIIREGVRLMA